MKSKITYIVICLSVVLGFTACIDDESTLNTIKLSELKIVGSDSETMPVYNFDLGMDCVINPDFSYSGNEDELQYEWSIGTYKDGVKGDLEVVGTERTLTYRFPEGGTYYAHLNITDGKVGQSMDYQVNINRTFENGYFLVSNDDNGKGNLVFIKTMTAEEVEAGAEQVYIEHSIEQMNEEVSLSKLLDVITFTASTEANWRVNYSRMVAFTEDRCLFLDPNTLDVLADLDYEGAYPGFKATRFLPDSYAPYLYDANAKKYAHLNMEYMFVYESAGYVGHTFEDYIVNNCLNYANKPSQTILFADYTNDEVYEYFAYLSNPFVGAGNILAGQEVLAAFVGKEGYVNPTYIVSRSKEDVTTGYLVKFPGGIANYVYYSTYYPSYVEDYTPSTTAFTIGDDTALPTEGTRFCYSNTYGRQFYVLDNKVYVALIANADPFPKKSEYAISYPAGEVISYMEINVETEELYVATYNESTKRGNFYIYDTKDVKTDAQGTIEPKVSHKQCADKITGVFYKKSL